MSEDELKGFWEFNTYGDEFFKLPQETQDAVEFLHWVDQEGGVMGLVHSRGNGVFPEELRDLAGKLDIAFDALSAELRIWAAKHGLMP